MRLLLAAVLVAASTPALAQAPCGYRDAIVADLAEKYQERLTSQGLTTDGDLLEIYVSPAGKWTALVTPPGSPLACIIQVGTDWDKPPGREA